jgi:peroxiredoxin
MRSGEQGLFGNLVVCLLALTLLMGCGGGAAEPASQAGPAAPQGGPTQTAMASTPEAGATANPGAPATSDIVQTSAQKDDDDDVFKLNDDDEDAAPAPGSPEALLREMAKLRTAPVDVVRQVVPGKPGQFEEVKLTPEQIVAEKALRWHTTIDKAMDVIVTTTNNPKQESLLNNAVHYLCDARVQLAMAGETDQAELLHQDAEALYKRNKESFAAAESAYKLLQFMQSSAEQKGREEQARVISFARQARLFSERFPKEVNRAGMSLLSAGRVCEFFNQPGEAKACYELVEAKFTGTPYADQVAAILRRLRLPGTKLAEFGGPTLDGGFVRLEDYAERPVLIVFWSKDSETFNKDLPQLLAVEKKYASTGFTVIGVNMDRDELGLETYLDKQGISWRQVFHSSPQSRGVRNPIAAHYGVTNVPTYWLVGKQGQVVAAPIAVEQLEAGLRHALQPQ